MSDLQEDLNFGISLDSNQPQKKQQAKMATSQTVNYNQNQNGLSLNSENYDLTKAAHPNICIMTIAFKIAAIVMYFVVGWFLSTILTFIFVLILSAIDFWIVKNLSGRLLVGLRWRSDYDSNGKQIWKFQSYNKNFKPNNVDKIFFWGSQAAVSAIWGIFLFLNIISLDIFWALLQAITFGLSATNLYGFYQCRGDHHKKVQDLKVQYGKKGLKSLAQRML